MSVQATGTRTSEFRRQAQAAADANLKRCLASSNIRLKNCPFSVGSASADAITATRNLKYTAAEQPGKLTITGRLGSEMATASGGSARISGQGRYNGQWATLQGTLSMSVSGPLTVKNGKVIFSQY